jgi:hypothetical protein
MSHENEDNIAVVVTGDAWEELYGILRPFLKDMAVWGNRHSLPLAAVEGMIWGVSEVFHEYGEGCPCETCLDIAERTADELFRRMTEAARVVRH